MAIACDDRSPAGIAEAAAGLTTIAGLVINNARDREGLQLLGDAFALALESAGSDTHLHILLELCLTLANGGRDLGLAILFGKLVLNAARRTAASFDRLGLPGDIRAETLSGHEGFYTHLMELLLEAGRLSEAERVTRMLKEEELYNLLRRDLARDPRETQIPLTRFEAEQVATIHERVSCEGVILAFERDRLSDTRVSLDYAQRQRLSELDHELQTRHPHIRLWLDDAITAFRDFSDQACDLEGVTEDDEACRRELDDVSTQLSLPVARLLLVGGRGRLHGVLHTSTGALPQRHETDVGRHELDGLIHDFRATIENGPDVGETSETLAKSRELYELLIRPFRETLDGSGVKVLLLSLTGSLRFLPFAALYSGKRFLIEDFAVLVLTETAKGNLAHPSQPALRAAGFGVCRRIEGYSWLPNVAHELAAIIYDGRSGRGPLPGECLIDEDFTESAVLRALEQRYPILHFATHFIFNPADDLTSYLLLGDGSHLTLERLAGPDFDFAGVDLVTLSACDTAMTGGASGHGRQVEGMAGLIQRRGAHAVLATLWPVADASTATLMAEFYGHRAERGFAKVLALQAAQIAMLERSRSVEANPGRDPKLKQFIGFSQLSLLLHGFRWIAGPAPLKKGEDTTNAALRSTKDPDESQVEATDSRPYAHPYFWAPFILMGNPL